MPYNAKIHHRKSIRLKGYDYSQEGAYFITICVQNRKNLFGEIVVSPLVGDQNADAQNAGVQKVGVQNAGVQNSDTQNSDTQNPAAQMILNEAGKMVETQWLALADRFPNIVLHEYIVMPNHFHGILQIVGVADAGVTDLQNGNLINGGSIDFQTAIGQPQIIAPAIDRSKTVGDMMDAFKSITTVEYIRGVKTMGWKPFGKNYGNVIITNTLYVMKEPTTTFQNTL